MDESVLEQQEKLEQMARAEEVVAQGEPTAAVVAGRTGEDSTSATTTIAGVKSEVEHIAEELGVLSAVAPSTPVAQGVDTSSVDEALATWLDRQRGSPIAQNTLAWNRLVAELPVLRQLLLKGK